MNNKEAIDKGYDKASEIDMRIDRLIEAYPPTNPENKVFWQVFVRTIRTSLDIIAQTIDYHGYFQSEEHNEQSNSN